MRTKGTETSLSPEMLGNTSTGAMDHTLLEMHFSICTLTGPRPRAELSLAVKSTNAVPGPIFLPAVFKRCFQTAHQSHKGGTSDASLLKETSTAHGAKAGWKQANAKSSRAIQTLLYPPSSVPLTLWDGAGQQGELFVPSLPLFSTSLRATVSEE